MKKRSVFAAVLLMVCLVFANVVCLPSFVQAKQLTKISQVKKLAKKQVKGASILKVEKDREDGQVVYEVKLSKGKKKYQLIYRASDSKLLSYEWELKSRYIKKGGGVAITRDKCKELALKEVSGATITKISQKFDDGVSLYKVKMKKGNKKYELKFHAFTGKLLEYEWELTNVKGREDAEYISEEKAKQIALKEAGGGTVVKIKFETDDGVAVYEVDIINGSYEYEIKIHARTGEILESDSEPVSPLPPQQGNTDQIGIDAAKEAAAADAGCTVSEVTFTKTKLDWEDGILIYEIEFYSATHEYEYEIIAATGVVYSKKKAVIPGGGSFGGSGTDIGVENAKQIALQEAGGGSVVKAEADTKDGVLVYEVDIRNGEFEYEITVDARTGKILEVDKEYQEDAQKPSGGGSRIDTEAAKEATLADAGVSAEEATFTKTELEREDGRVVYEIEFFTATHKYEYEIDASTGAVYSKKKEVAAGGSSGNTGKDIGIDAATQIALQEAGGVAVEKAEQKTEDGVLVYEVEIRNGNVEYEIKIDALTGNVLEVEIDSI